MLEARLGVAIREGLQHLALSLRRGNWRGVAAFATIWKAERACWRHNRALQLEKDCSIQHFLEGVAIGKGLWHSPPNGRQRGCVGGVVRCCNWRGVAPFANFSKAHRTGRAKKGRVTIGEGVEVAHTEKIARPRHGHSP